MTKRPFGMSCILLCALIPALVTPLSAQPNTLKGALESVSSTIDGDVGVAVIDLQSGEAVSLDGNNHFPMQSVYKIHIALATLRLVDQGTLSLSQKYRVTKDHYFKTWSVLMRAHPEAQVDVTLNELVTWTVTNSDNVACDMLLEILGGPTEVQKFIETLGITDVNIVATERKMHSDWNVQFSNWTTPNAMAHLLKLFYKNKILTNESTKLLWKLMVDTPNAPKRLKGMLPEGTVVARKPGTGDTNGQVFGAVNDVGIVMLPNGQKIIVAAFVTHGRGKFNALEEGIARMAKVIYDHFSD